MRKNAIISLILLVTIVFFWLIKSTSKNLTTIKNRQELLLRLPNLSLFTKDSVKFRIETGQPIVLIYFNSNCEHCQYEVNDVYNNIQSFDEAKVLFLSSESTAQIKAFADTNKLLKFPNVTFAKIESAHAAEIFGTLSVPHIFIYGQDGKLRKEFRGETKAEAIAKYLN